MNAHAHRGGARCSWCRCTSGAPSASSCGGAASAPAVEEEDELGVESTALRTSSSGATGRPSSSTPSSFTCTCTRTCTYVQVRSTGTDVV